MNPRPENQAAVLSEKDRGSAIEYTWSYFLSHFARRGAQVANTKPFEFNTTMMANLS